MGHKITHPPQGGEETTTTTGGGSSSGGGDSLSATEIGSGLTTEQRAARAERERKQRKARMQKERRLAFQAQVMEWDVPMTKGIRKLVNRMAKKEFGMGAFQQMLRRTKAYKQRFIGLRNRPGLTEGEYIEAEQEFIDAAKDFGINLSREQIVYSIVNDISPQSFETRLEAITRIKDNPLAFQQFSNTLQQRGYGPLSLQQSVDFLLGKALPEIKAIYDEMFVTSQVEQAGLGGFVNRTDILEFIARGGATEEETTERLINLADQIRSLVPASRMTGFGLTERQLVEMELNPMSPQSRETAGLVEKIVRDVQARQANTTATPIVAERLATGRPKKATSL